MKYEVKWRGETYYASDLTDELKFKYCQWLFDHMLENAAKYMEAARYLRFEKKLMASPPEWTSIGDESVIASLEKEPGIRAMIRVILDVSANEKHENYLSEDDLTAMLTEKAAETSDLSRAMKRIKENADPKAQSGGPGSPRPVAETEPTQASATNQSD